MLPDPRDRAERMRRFFATELREVAIPRGLVWTTEIESGDPVAAEAGQAAKPPQKMLAGAAVWAPPGDWRVPVTTLAREVAPMTRAFGRRLPLALWSRLRMDARHPKGPSHWYLATMGVAPESQGRGLGTALMRPALDAIDADSLPAYLESSTPRSRALYERHGFVVTGKLNYPMGGPPMWLMWREARARS